MKTRNHPRSQRRALHRLRADAATTRRAAQRAGSPSASVADLRFDQLIYLTEETQTA